jgi:ribosomal protein L11 methyltransferase
MDSIRISIEANDELQDILISRLSDLDAEGFEQTDTHLIAYFNEISFKSYEVNEILKEHRFESHTLKEQNWNAAWEHSFQPVLVGKFCAIRAGFHPAVSQAEHEIVITPKMSFGTGHHATTYMIIDQMSAIDFKGKSVFDFGTGTGILAILAEKLGAASVLAIDADPWSIENATENIAGNNCSKISLAMSSQPPSKAFDIILANINRNVILQYLPQLKVGLSPNGLLLLSGLLQTDESDLVEACLRERFDLKKRTERNKWISLLLVNGR